MPPRRSVSTRQSSRAGPSRISSIVIHDTDDEEGEGEKEKEVEHTQELELSTPPLTRSRKAKGQTRLGVGRPAAAGGTGPRAVTKTSKFSKSKRAKSSRTVQPTEATIFEGVLYRI